MHLAATLRSCTIRRISISYYIYTLYVIIRVRATSVEIDACPTTTPGAKGDAKRLARCGKCDNARARCETRRRADHHVPADAVPPSHTIPSPPAGLRRVPNCTDKPKFGGPGVKKQACINRKCAS